MMSTIGGFSKCIVNLHCWRGDLFGKFLCCGQITNLIYSFSKLCTDNHHSSFSPEFLHPNFCAFISSATSFGYVV